MKKNKVVNNQTTKQRRKNKLEDLKEEELSSTEKTGLLIKRAREEKNLTQEQLGEILNTSRQNISKWENGKSLPDAEYLLQISEELGLNLYKLISGESKPVNYNSKEMKEIAINGMKLYISKAKQRMLTIAMSIVLGIATICAITIYIFNIYKWNLYNFNNLEGDITFNGTIMTNKKESIYTFSDFSYFSADIGTIDEPIIKESTIKLIYDTEEIYAYETSYDKELPLSNCFENMNIKFNTNDKLYQKDKDIYLLFDLTTKENKHIIKKIKIERN